MTPDNFRLLAILILHRAQELVVEGRLASIPPALKDAEVRELVTAAYNERCRTFEYPDSLSEGITEEQDVWALAYAIAIGFLDHTTPPRGDPELAIPEAIRALKFDVSVKKAPRPAQYIA